MKTLHLNLKKKWFDMILSGDKKEEYREISGYWMNRLLFFPYDFEATDELHHDLHNPYRHKDYEELFNHFGIKYRDFDTITFSNGYSKNRPQFEIELRKIFISKGNHQWGAVGMTNYFVLELGNLID